MGIKRKLDYNVSVCDWVSKKTMRKNIEAVYKDTFRDIALKTRFDLGFTQAKMSEALLMSERSYEEIESGRSACGAVTAMLLLLYIEHRNEVLDKLKTSMEKAYDEEVVHS